MSRGELERIEQLATRAVDEFRAIDRHRGSVSLPPLPESEAKRVMARFHQILAGDVTPPYETEDD